MKMANRRLFPAVREAGERVVVAPGTSCREQILDGTQRRALHPAEYLASLLDGSS
jgi:Fe-S oxidoreductase